MARKVFFSFHYQPDNWRVSQVRNIGVIEGNQPAKDNDWETVVGGVIRKLKNGYLIKWWGELAQLFSLVRIQLIENGLIMRSLNLGIKERVL